MNPFSGFGKMLIFLGLIITVIGLVMVFGSKIPWIGKLPGDITVKKDNFQIYFPLATCVIISILLTLLFNIFKK